MMSNEIKSINEKVLQPGTLPDGQYYGIWNAYKIDICYKGKEFALITKDIIRGVGFEVTVNIKDGVATFERNKNNS